MPLPFRSLTPSVGTASSSPRALSKDVANAPKKEPLDFTDGRCSQDLSNDGSEVDHISLRLSELQGELFLSLKEDIAEWIIKTLGVDVQIDADNFVHALDTGVILCRLSLAIEERAREAKRQGIIQENLPDYKLHCNKNAKSGTWFARDNTANFLKWCRAFGMMDETLFDSEDLVAHHQERQVIYCLMELARLGARFGLEPPTLISMEKEIDSEEPPPTPVQAPPPPVMADPPTPHESPPPTPPIVEKTPPSTPPPPPRKDSTASSKGSSISTLDSEVYNLKSFLALAPPFSPLTHTHFLKVMIKKNYERGREVLPLLAQVSPKFRLALFLWSVSNKVSSHLISLDWLYSYGVCIKQSLLSSDKFRLAIPMECIKQSLLSSDKFRLALFLWSVSNKVSSHLISSDWLYSYGVYQTKSPLI
ncbi:hypothetical protein RRG08_002840 [Elysia crispata]|uniref:Calponin-homology (CH) domain-containing protein n=1 Tax=Elysia crispata TaxID=231223 RepID=A0AAE1CMG0_9GAST|nr:hypothetical protein RRG08_002840 [Elysia crispata]